MTRVATKRPRLSIDITNGSIERHIKIAAARRDMTIKHHCLQVITAQLVRDGELPAQDAEVRQAQALAERMDRLRREIGPTGVLLCRLTEAGRDDGWEPE
jgi:hypothetical protein